MSVVLNTTIPSSSLKKKCNAIAYHRVREAIAANVVQFGHVNSKDNFPKIIREYLHQSDKTLIDLEIAMAQVFLFMNFLLQKIFRRIGNFSKQQKRSARIRQSSNRKISSKLSPISSATSARRLATRMATIYRKFF